jgi:hypothetical protein
MKNLRIIFIGPVRREKKYAQQADAIQLKTAGPAHAQKSKDKVDHNFAGRKPCCQRNLYNVQFQENKKCTVESDAYHIYIYHYSYLHADKNNQQQRMRTKKNYIHHGHHKMPFFVSQPVFMHVSEYNNRVFFFQHA